MLGIVACSIHDTREPKPVSNRTLTDEELEVGVWYLDPVVEFPSVIVGAVRKKVLSSLG